MKVSTCLLLTASLLPLVAYAQDEAPEAPETPGFLMFNQNMVPGSDLAALNESVDSTMKPILDAMADEGLIYNWGILTHSWGDEWNWNWYMFTKDHASFVSAWSTFVERALAADSVAFATTFGYLKAHKDNTYAVRHFKGRELEEGEAPPKFIMLNYHKINDLGAANAQFDSTSAVVLNGMLDEGIIPFWGQANHSWGDEWSFHFWFGSDDHADFLSDWSVFVKRMQENYPSSLDDWNAVSTAHKDNLYNIRYAK